MDLVGPAELSSKLWALRQGWAGMTFWHFGTRMAQPIPKLWEREREWKFHAQFLGTGPVFPGMVANENSRSPLTVSGKGKNTHVSWRHCHPESFCTLLWNPQLKKLPKCTDFLMVWKLSGWSGNFPDGLTRRPTAKQLNIAMAGHRFWN